MARVRTNTKLKPSKKADLQVVKPVKTTRYSDIDLNNWKAYDHVKTDTLWEFPTRLKEGGHSNEYHGNYIPQIAQQLYERFTKKNDVVLDLFFGSGTSGIEAINMGRRCIGVELKDELAESVSQKFTPKQLVTDQHWLSILSQLFCCNPSLTVCDTFQTSNLQALARISSI